MPPELVNSKGCYNRKNFPTDYLVLPFCYRFHITRSCHFMKCHTVWVFFGCVFILPLHCLAVTISSRRGCSKPHKGSRPNNQTLNTPRVGAFSLGSLFQCLTSFPIKNFSLISAINLLSFSLKPLHPVLSLLGLVKTPFLAFLYGPSLRSGWC